MASTKPEDDVVHLTMNDIGTAPKEGRVLKTIREWNDQGIRPE